MTSNYRWLAVICNPEQDRPFPLEQTQKIKKTAKGGIEHFILIKGRTWGGFTFLAGWEGAVLRPFLMGNISLLPVKWRCWHSSPSLQNSFWLYWQSGELVVAVSNAVVMATNLSFGDGKKIVVAGHLLKL